MRYDHNKIESITMPGLIKKAGDGAVGVEMPNGHIQYYRFNGSHVLERFGDKEPITLTNGVHVIIEDLKFVMSYSGPEEYDGFE